MEEQVQNPPPAKQENVQENDPSDQPEQNFGGRDRDQQHNPRFNRPRGGGRGRGGRNFNPNFRNFGHNQDRRNFNRGGHRNEDGTESQDMEPFDFKEKKLYEKLASIAGPTTDLPPLDVTEKQFSGRNRLYIGNIAQDVTEDDLKELLSKSGEISELFFNKEKNFAFVKFDYFANAEKAKRELDGCMFKGKNFKVRIAPNNASIKIKNLSNFVSNELLYHAFSVFGEIERALVLVDERGKSTGEGIVEFARKGSAISAIKKCSERCFFINESLRPCVVEPYEFVNDTDGIPEKLLPKRNHDFLKTRSKGPRLAELNTFEHEYGVRWKQLIELYAQKEDALKKELQMEKEKLEAQMEYARYEHETEMLREQLRAREQDRDRQKQEWEMREREVEEERRRAEEMIRAKEETLQTKMVHQEEEMKRRQQENNLFMQAHELNNMLDEQEEKFERPEPFVNNMERFPEQQNMGGNFNGQNMRNQRGGFRRDRWVTERRDDFQPKRRRF